MKYSIMIIIVFIVLQIVDVITTLKALKVPGVSEGNPITYWLMDKVGATTAMILISVLNIVAMCGVLYLIHPYKAYYNVEYIIQGIMVIVCLFRVYAVYTNIRNMSYVPETIPTQVIK